VPQLIVPLQPSETAPQFLPAQEVVIEAGVHPHTLGEPGAPPPHVCPEGQLPPIEPHVTVPVPQPLSMVPQFFPAPHAAIGVHVLAHVPLEQTVPAEHAPFSAPQLTAPPQPFGIVPQLRDPQAAAALCGAQPQTPATEGLPPPQVCGAVQLPQLIVPPQPSAAVPQFLLPQASALDFGVQPHKFGVPAPPQVCGATQLVAHPTASPQLFEMLPHRAPSRHV
jgi:hypothetical protein